MTAPYQEDLSHLEQIVEIAHEAVVTIDADLRIVAFNRGAERMFGYPRHEMLGTPLNRLLPKSVTAHHTRLVQDFLKRGPQDRLMAPRRPVCARDSRGQEFEVLISIYSTGIGNSAIATAVIVDPSERRESNEQLQLLLEQNRRNGRQLIKRDTDYRRHLARTIHNDLAQEAVSINVNLELARQQIAMEAGTLEPFFQRIEEATQRFHATVDQLLKQTRPPALDHLLLPEAIEDCVHRLGIRESGISLVTVIDPTARELDDPVKTVTYRIVQESLTNIMRHARPQASRIRLQIYADSEIGPRRMLHIQVDDDGPGPQACSDDRSNGIGLQQIREWCTALGGCMETGTSQWDGFRLRVTFPTEEGAQ